MALAPAAAADTFRPTRFDDPPPDRCKPRNCSLREAIDASNDHTGRDTVILRKGTYELEIPPGPIVGSGSLDLIDGLILRGQGPGKTKIDANEIDRVAECFLDIQGDTYTLRDLTLTRGDAGPDPHSSGGGLNCGAEPGDEVRLMHMAITQSSASENGGGLQVGEHTTVRITHSKFVKNEALRGGAMILLPRLDGPSVKIRDSLISGNEAAFGGGIYSGAAELTIERTTIAGNAGDEGGGMDLVAAPTIAPTTFIRASTISGNSARKGGGILADGNQPPGSSGPEPVVRLLNSTVAGNHTSAEGGGIMADNQATMTLDSSTVAYNLADEDNVNGGVGGGVHQHSGSVFSLGDSIVAANSVGSSGAGQQCDGAFSTDADGLIIQSQTSGTCSYGGDYTIVADALIGPLSHNGGPTQTVRLKAGSPAIGNAGSCPKHDQRGVKRPKNGCDSGAFERKKP
jgi:hypothetical protein